MWASAGASQQVAAGICHTGAPCGCQEESLLHFCRYLLEETSLLFGGDLPP